MSTAVPAPWMPKSASKHCMLCQQSFSIFSWRHHCRHCGVLCCDNCSDHKVFNIPGYPSTVPKRKTTNEPSQHTPGVISQQGPVSTSSSGFYTPSTTTTTTTTPGTTTMQSDRKALEGIPERVCDSCFLQEYAYVLVYNLMLSGWHIKVLSVSAEDAIQQFTLVPSYASRVLMKIGNETVLASHFARDTWERRVMEKARWTIREKKSRYVLRYWLGEGVTGQNGVPPQYQLLQQQQQGGGVGVPASAPSATAPPPMMVEDRLLSIQLGVMILFRQDGADATDHFFLNFPYASPEEVVAEGGRFLHAVPRLQYGCVLELAYVGDEGVNAAGIPNPTLRMHHLTQKPPHNATPQAWLKTFQQYFEQLSTVLVVQEDAARPPRVEFGKFQQLYTSCKLLERQWQRDAATSPQHGRAFVLLDVTGNMVLVCSPSHEVKERLGMIAGDAIMSRQGLSAIIAVHPAVSVTAPSVTRRTETRNGGSTELPAFSNAIPSHSIRPLGVSPPRQQQQPGQSSHVALQSSLIAATALYDMYSARTFLWATAGTALFAVATHSTVPVLLQHHIYLTKAEALADRAPVAVQKVDSLIRQREDVAPMAPPSTVATAPRMTEEGEGEGGQEEEPSVPVAVSRRAMSRTTPPPPPPPPAAAAPAPPASMGRIIPECGICFLPFNGDAQRPCLCALCGNSMCLQCMTCVDSCPFCRRQIPRTADGGFITNVMLMQMIAGDD